MKLRLCPGYNLNEMYLTFGVILVKSYICVYIYLVVSCGVFFKDFLDVDHF